MAEKLLKSFDKHPHLEIKRESEETHTESGASGLVSHIGMNFLFIHSGTILQLLPFAS